MPVRPDDVYEFGIIVPDLERALEELNRAFGYTFSPIFEGHLPLRGSEGDALIPLRVAYSKQFPHLEVIEERPGTYLVAPPGTSLHHIGAWVDDLDAESTRLEGLGMPMTLCGFVGEKSPALYTFHSTGFGALLELVSREGKADFDQLVFEGSIPEAPELHQFPSTR